MLAATQTPLRVAARLLHKEVTTIRTVCSHLAFLLQNASFFRVGDAGFEPATSAV